MRLLPSPLPRTLRARTALPLAALFLALGSVVHASIRAVSGARSVPQARFDLAGELRGPLWPGGSQPVDVALVNHMHYELWVTDLRVTLSIDPAHVSAGCSAARDFAVAQLPASAFPIRLPARHMFRTGWPARFGWTATPRWWLGELGVRQLPAVTMVDLAQTDQDGCKGASVRLRFTADARRRRQYVAVRGS